MIRMKKHGASAYVDNKTRTLHSYPVSGKN